MGQSMSAGFYELLRLFSDLTGNTPFTLRPGYQISTMQSCCVFLKTSCRTRHHGCSMIEGFVMT